MTAKCTDCRHYRCLPDNQSRTAVGAVYRSYCEQFRRTIKDIGQAENCSEFDDGDKRKE